MRRCLSVLLCLVFLLSGCARLTEDPLLRVSTVDAPLPQTGRMAQTEPPALPDIPADAADAPVNDPWFGVDISFLAMGDNLIHPNIYMDARKRGNAEKEYDFLPVYADISSHIAGADFAFINQETVMAGESYGYSGYPTFNSPRQLGLDMVALGFDIINIANNHMLDMGAAGLADTVDFWKSQPVTLLGAAYAPAEPVILEQDGVKIALLSYTYSTNGFSQGKDALIQIPYIEEERILSDIQYAKNHRADVIIASVHWGTENTPVPTDSQTSLAQLMADAGVDVILGHHSHCLQPITWLSGTEGHKTLCIYSLGNSISGMAAPLNQVGGMLTFSIVSDGAGGLQIASPLLIPTVFYYGPNWFNTHLYLLEDYTEDIAASHGVSINGYTLSAEKARQIVTDVIDAQFLPDWLRTNE